MICVVLTQSLVTVSLQALKLLGMDNCNDLMRISTTLNPASQVLKCLHILSLLH